MGKDNHCKPPTMINPNTRVNQLDATLLDQELFNNLLKQSLSIFNKIAPIYKTKYNNEIEFLLRSLIYKLTIWDKGQSYGMFLQNLKYKNLNTLKKLNYYLVFILGYYISQKLSSFVYEDDEENDGSRRFKLIRLFKKLYIYGEKGYKLLSLLNFLDFLITGKYQSLNLRLLNVKITVFSIELAKLNKGNVSFEFQNRQLIWNTFLEFIVFILPIFQNSKFQSLVQRLLTKKSNEPTDEAQQLKFRHLKEKQCAICFENDANKIQDYRITNPYVTKCGHLYCYICLISKLEHAKVVDEVWKCHRCGKPVRSAVPFNDVDANAIKFALEDSEAESDEEADDDDQSSISHISEVEQGEQQFDGKDAIEYDDEDYENYDEGEGDEFDDDELEEYDEEGDYDEIEV